MPLFQPFRLGLFTLSVVTLVFTISPLFGQRSGGGNTSGGRGGNTTNTPSAPGSNLPTSPGPGIGNTTNGTRMPDRNIYNPTPDFGRPVFLSGRVMMDDGSKPSTEITIQRVCNGNPHTEAHVDNKGRFSFQVGANPMAIMDASEGAMDNTGGRFGNPAAGYGSFGVPGRGGISAQNLMGCHLQAYYPGYRSDIVDLTTRHALDNPEVGVIVLHRLGNVQGTAISMTSMLAPKKARKNYEKALDLVGKRKPEDATKHLQEAVTEYPKYAAAWYELGRIQTQAKDYEGARKSFEAAIGADSKYVNPYDGLALLAAQQGNWQEAADRSKQAVYLNPVEFPTSWFYNALANYNLKKPDLAEKSAQEVVKLDGAHRLAQVETLLAQLCMERSDYSGAAQHLQTYLKLQPNAPNADALRQQLAKLQAANVPSRK